MRLSDKSAGTLLGLWNRGQDDLVAGRYVAARRALESAEAMAWRHGDLQSLARIYLPLLEARRQIRYNAADGLILITAPITPKNLAAFLSAQAGTILLMVPATALAVRKARANADLVQRHCRRTGRWFEAAILLVHKKERRFVSAVEPHFSAGILTTFDAKTPLAASTDAGLTLPFPAPGLYALPPEQPLARESLLIGWEALALKWQHRHRPCVRTPWEELAWLRNTLRIDPACEPVTMRLIALAESLIRLNVAPGRLR